ncbi:MAG TPA: hypothetical protein PKA55_19930 [Rhodoblastus sp.]|nr:hypothetical protein [Rhodoblastus sp.]
MRGIREFVCDTKGGLVERVAIMAGAVALASIGGAHFLGVASRDPHSKLYALLAPSKPGVGNPPGGVDYTPTASIRKQAGQVVLDPCTGKPK